MHRVVIFPGRGGGRPGVAVDDAGCRLDFRALRSLEACWALVAEHRRCVLLDLHTGSFATGGSDPVYGLGAAPRAAPARQRYRERGVTHLLLFPLLEQGGEVGGQCAVELACEPLVGERARPWSGCDQTLGRLGARCGPALLELARDEPLTPIALGVAPGRMGAALRRLRRFAVTDETLLIGGPSGSGKSQLAAAAHRWSSRSGGPFETVFLSAVPANLVEGELFGWMPSAFTEARQRRVGQVARAEGGTLFIDEIDKLSLQVQQKLLYLLETRRYRVLGDSGPERHADVRFIVATNVDLEEAVLQGRVLEDLYWRINSLRVDLPPLRERTEEIGDWALFMAERVHRRAQPEGAVALTDEAVLALTGWTWPGNLRELDSVIKTACLHEVGDALDAGGCAPKRLTLTAASVREALGRRGAPHPSSLEAAMRRLAAAYLDEADRRRAGGRPPLTVDHARALGGFVLEEAARRYGERGAFLSLGMDGVVKQRNHARQLRAAEAEVAAFLEALEG